MLFSVYLKKHFLLSLNLITQQRDTSAGHHQAALQQSWAAKWNTSRLSCNYIQNCTNTVQLFLLASCWLSVEHFLTDLDLAFLNALFEI